MCSLLSKMLLGPIGCIQRGLVVFGSVLDLPASLCSCEDTRALEQIVSVVIDGTVELEVFALACCTNQHCKCFLYASGFMVLFLHVAWALPLG